MHNGGTSDTPHTNSFPHETKKLFPWRWNVFKTQDTHKQKCNLTVFNFLSRKIITTMASKAIMITRTMFTLNPLSLLPLLLVAPVPAQSMKNHSYI